MNDETIMILILVGGSIALIIWILKFRNDLKNMSRRKNE